MYLVFHCSTTSIFDPRHENKIFPYCRIILLITTLAKFLKNIKWKRNFNLWKVNVKIIVKLNELIYSRKLNQVPLHFTFVSTTFSAIHVHLSWHEWLFFPTIAHKKLHQMHWIFCEADSYSGRKAQNRKTTSALVFPIFHSRWFSCDPMHSMLPINLSSEL